MQIDVRLTIRDSDDEEYNNLTENDVINLKESIKYEMDRFTFITDSGEIIHLTIAKIEDKV